MAGNLVEPQPRGQGWAGRCSLASSFLLICLEPGMQGVEALLHYLPTGFQPGLPRELGTGTASSAGALIPTQPPVPAPHFPALLPDPLHYKPPSPPPPRAAPGAQTHPEPREPVTLLATHTTLLPSRNQHMRRNVSKHRPPLQPPPIPNSNECQREAAGEQEQFQSAPYLLMNSSQRGDKGAGDLPATRLFTPGSPASPPTAQRSSSLCPRYTFPLLSHFPFAPVCQCLSSPACQSFSIPFFLHLLGKGLDYIRKCHQTKREMERSILKLARQIFLGKIKGQILLSSHWTKIWTISP